MITTKNELKGIAKITAIINVLILSVRRPFFITSIHLRPLQVATAIATAIRGL